MVHPFRAAVEARDIAAIGPLLAEDVVFSSPIVHAPYAGREVTMAVLSAVVQVFEDFAYDLELASPDGHTHALVFSARIGDRELQGCDFLHHRDDGLIDRLMVMIRPLSAAHALRDRMAALLAAAG